MMAALLAGIPLQFRLGGLFVLGVCLGCLVNLGAYRLAWNPRSISPWSRAPKGVPARRPDDRVPIFGWLGLRRESKLHGRGFWIRPMLVELLSGVGLAMLYWWEVGQAGLWVPAPNLIPAAWAGILNAQFFCHAVLITLMLVASLIDIDEKTIPDAIAVPGTLLGLVAAALYPWSLLPANVAGPPGDFLLLTSPKPWLDWLNGLPHFGSLGLALGCLWLWCFALMTRTWYSRHGWLRALGLMLARLRRDPSTRTLVLLGLVGSLGIVGVWLLGGARWQGLLTSLVGMAAGGGLIWVVRIIGAATLHREAMGFGDVTLMAMLGAFLGWQSCLVIFFLAPFAALVIGVFNLLLHSDHEIPYGPFLCLAAVVTIVRWASLWSWLSGVFALGLAVPLVMVVCLALMGLLLGFWRLVQRAMGIRS
jgi:prepilin signal peptidase PulO-like enzyme (type II secretory pathway)